MGQKSEQVVVDVESTARNPFYRDVSERMERIGDLELWLLGVNELPAFNEFVFRVYGGAFSKDEQDPVTRKEIDETGETFFRHAKVCAVKHVDGTLVGTWGLILKDLEQESDFALPIERSFDLTVPQILERTGAQGIRYFFNGWRTAVDKAALDRLGYPKTASIFVFDCLLRGLTEDFSGESHLYMGVAEMEMLVYKYHRRVGVPWQILSDGKVKWGRERFPCAFKLAEFKSYLLEHHPERYRFIYEKGSAAGLPGAP